MTSLKRLKKGIDMGKILEKIEADGGIKGRQRSGEATFITNKR
jgi:hypothetical protein